MDNKESLLKEKKSIGVIISRMQVPYLTESHKKLISTVYNRHERIIIFLGTTNNLIDEKNPYPFEFRKQMLEYTTFPSINTVTFSNILKNSNVSIVPLPDQEDNASWVKALDRTVQSFLSFEEDAILYGGRDSFIPYYKKDNGKFSSVELSAEDYDSGTELRFLSSIKLPKYSAEAATAILWALRQIKK